MFKSIPLPTVPIINIGPEFEVKEQILCASSLEINFWPYKSAVIFAPIGYPQSMLIKKTYDEIAGLLYSFFVMGENSFEKFST